MSRALRIQFPGAHYHVMSRGNARQRVFLDDADHHAYLDLLGEVCVRFDWHCHGHCLMPNHVHLLIETRAPNLSRGMRHLNGVFTQRYNERRKRVGHLFQGRFKALLVDHDAYLLGLVRYILLNPVRAELVRDAIDWRWSSIAWASAKRPAPSWASPATLWRHLGVGADRAAQRVAELLAMEPAAPQPDWEHEGVVGSEVFKTGLRAEIVARRDDRDKTVATRFADRPALAQLLRDGSDKPSRDRGIRNAVLRWGYSQTAVARHLGLGMSTVSGIVSATAARKPKT